MTEEIRSYQFGSGVVELLKEGNNEWEVIYTDDEKDSAEDIANIALRMASGEITTFALVCGDMRYHNGTVIFDNIQYVKHYFAPTLADDDGDELCSSGKYSSYMVIHKHSSKPNINGELECDEDGYFKLKRRYAVKSSGGDVIATKLTLEEATDIQRNNSLIVVEEM